MTVSGQCLCGGVKVTIADDALPLAPMACHCNNCRTTAGSSYSLVHMLPLKSLTVDGDSVSAYKDKDTLSGKPTKRHFCNQCGTPIHTTAESVPNMTFLKLGLFAGKEPIDKPNGEVFWANHEEWEKPIAGAKVFDHMPQ